MKLNDYLKDVYDLSHSEFETLPNDIQKSIREEHTTFLNFLNKCKLSKNLIERYLKSQGWVEGDDGYMYKLK
jgi:hypothetical protein